mgnify:CR=1 FL=1
MILWFQHWLLGLSQCEAEHSVKNSWDSIQPLRARYLPPIWHILYIMRPNSENNGRIDFIFITSQSPVLCLTLEDVLMLSSLSWGADFLSTLHLLSNPHGSFHHAFATSFFVRRLFTLGREVYPQSHLSTCVRVSRLSTLLMFPLEEFEECSITYRPWNIFTFLFLSLPTVPCQTLNWAYDS